VVSLINEELVNAVAAFIVLYKHLEGIAIVDMNGLIAAVSSQLDMHTVSVDISVNRNLVQELTMLPVNVKQVNGINIVGSGIDGSDEWRRG
jgi:hypothetical protein